jgi:hypothetical protein
VHRQRWTARRRSVPKQLFQYLLELEIVKALRLRYCVSLLSLAM